MRVSWRAWRELCRKALESPTCSCSHVRCGRSLLDRSIRKEHIHWKIFKVFRKLLKGHQGQEQRQQRRWPHGLPCDSRPASCVNVNVQSRRTLRSSSLLLHAQSDTASSRVNDTIHDLCTFPHAISMIPAIVFLNDADGKGGRGWAWSGLQESYYGCIKTNTAQRKPLGPSLVISLIRKKQDPLNVNASTSILTYIMSNPKLQINQEGQNAERIIHPTLLFLWFHGINPSLVMS